MPQHSPPSPCMLVKQVSPRQELRSVTTIISVDEPARGEERPGVEWRSQPQRRGCSAFRQRPRVPPASNTADRFGGGKRWRPALNSSSQRGLKQCLRSAAYSGRQNRCCLCLVVNWRRVGWHSDGPADLGASLFHCSSFAAFFHHDSNSPEAVGWAAAQVTPSATLSCLCGVPDPCRVEVRRCNDAPRACGPQNLSKMLSVLTQRRHLAVAPTGSPSASNLRRAFSIYPKHNNSPI